jgi:NADH:ubiquinone reductase (H+-translocating)
MAGSRATAKSSVVIVGGGFAGLNAARALRRADAEVTVVDRRNFHLFQPLLYQVATGTLSPGEIATPIRSILRRQRNARVLLGEVRGFDVAEHRLGVDDDWIRYDHLIVATGSQTSYFGHDEWVERAPGLKTIEDAIRIRGRVLLAFERAEATSDPAQRAELMTFVIVGAGPTGVELAGQIAEMARWTLRREFRRVDPASAQVILIDAGPRVLPTFPERLSARAQRDLERLGVTVIVSAPVVSVDDRSITFARAGGQQQAITAGTVVWAAGVSASPLGRLLADAAAAATDRMGRVVTRPDLTLEGHPEIRLCGDLAHVVDPATGEPQPGVAQVAIQQGRYAGRSVAAELRGGSLQAFRYRDPGAIATIGRNKAVADIRGIRLAGYPAWLFWAGLHLVFLVGHLNRVVVLTRWVWSYVTNARGGRLITGA